MTPLPGRATKAIGRVRLEPVRPTSWWFALAVLAAVGAAYLWTRPLEEQVTVPHPYTSSYTFDYGTNLPPNQVYDTGQLKFGDTLFRSLSDRLALTVKYRLTNGDTATAVGNLSTRVLLSSSAGWTRTIEELPAAPITGSVAETRVLLDFGAMERLAKSINETTKTEGTLSVQVLTGVDARLSTPGLEDRPAPSAAGLKFELTETTVRLKEDRSAPSTGLSEGESGGVKVMNGGANQTTTQMLQTRALKPAEVSALVFSARVDQARIAAVAVLGVALAVSLYNLLAVAMAGARGEAARLAAQYGSQLYPLLEVPADIDRRAVRVGSFDALAAAAENAEAEILHHAKDGGDRYYVFDGPNVFCYEAGAR